MSNLLSSSAVALLLSFAALPASAASIGVATPLSGASAPLGQQMRSGVEAAVRTVSDREITLDVRDDACTAEGGQAAARAFAEAKVDLVVGFLCIESIEAAMPILKEAGITVITPAVRVDSLTDSRQKNEWDVYRIAPRDDQERQAAAAKLIPAWRSELFAVVDDGTIYGRELAESFRAAAEAEALKPVFVDTFRPQSDNQIGLLGRLRRAGATHVLVGGDREDIAIMGRDANQLGYTLTIAGGEALREAGDVPLAIGTLMIAPPDWSQSGNPETLASLRDENVDAAGYVLPAYAAMEIAATALGDAESTERTIPQILNDETFTTAIGEITFDDKGDLAENPYRLYRFDGTRFVEVPE